MRWAIRRPRTTSSIAHELLHTVGATDKYDPDSNEPRYPTATRSRSAIRCCRKKYAEIMAGRFSLTSTTSRSMPGILDEVMIGAKTAREINWQSLEPDLRITLLRISCAGR
jgi:hypothetical protein